MDGERNGVTDVNGHATIDHPHRQTVRQALCQKPTAAAAGMQ